MRQRDKHRKEKRLGMERQEQREKKNEKEKLFKLITWTMNTSIQNLPLTNPPVASKGVSFPLHHVVFLCNLGFKNNK